MATLNKTYGITLVVNNSTTEYGGANSNEYFGGSSDRIAMLRFDAPAQLAANQLITAARHYANFKADTTPDSDTIVIGLIDGAWTTTTTDFTTLYSYIEATTETESITTSLTEAALSFSLTSLLQAWAANPSTYSGLYYRRSTLSLTRIGATGQSIVTTVETRTAGTPPSSVWMDSAMSVPGGSVNLNWSGQGAGYLNPTVGYKIGRSENGGAWNDSWATAAGSPLAVTAHSSYGNYYSYRVITDGQYIDSGASAAATLTAYTPTACGAPSALSLAKTLADPSEGGIALSWSGATPGTINLITGYMIQRSIDGGAWADWQSVQTTANSYSYTVIASANYGGTFGYRIVTQGSAGASYNSSVSAPVTLTSRTPTACGAPSAASLSASLAETAPTLNYSGASGGTINTITGYEILYADSADGSIWGGWAALATVANTGTSGSVAVALPATRGYYRKYAIRTQGSAGASYYSGWAYTAAVRYNSAPTAPTSFAAAPAVYVSGAISLSYPGATDPDNNISTYNVQFATSADGVTWSGWTALADGAISHTPTLSPGYYIKYQARAVDAFGVVSGWTVSNVCGKNTAPAAPLITYPQNSKMIYNSRPRFLLTIGADPESHAQSIAAAGFTPSRASGLVTGSKVILRRDAAASAGGVSISAVSTDLYAEASSAVARDTTYAVPSFTDTAIVKGATPIKAAHMTELRTMINTVRAYYGMGANLLSGADYETAADDWIKNTAESAYYFSSDTAKFGTKSLIITKPGNNAYGGVYLSYENFIIGRAYTFSMWAYKDSGIFSIWCSSGGASARIDLGGWNYYSYTFIATSTSGILYIIAQATAQPASVYIERPKLELSSVATDWTTRDVVWNESITAGITKSRNWAAHVVEMQAAINDIVTLVNGWDTASTVNRVILPAWLVPGAKPSAAIMEQIRAAIPLL